MRGSWICVTAVIGLTIPAAAFEEATAAHSHITSPNPGPGWEFAAGALWESRYSSEGRDNLGGDSLFSTQIEAAFENWNGSLWFAESPGSSYREVQAELSQEWVFGPLAIEMGGVFLWFPDDEEDQELGLQLAYEIAPHWEVHWHGYYSLEADGIYQVAEIVANGWEFGPVETEAKVGAGFNGGYIEDGHRGLDHVSVAVDAEWGLDETWSVIGRVSYVSSVDDDPALKPGDVDLYTGFQVGLGVTASF